MAYEKQTWNNLPDKTTPLSAARLNHLETQYDEAVAYTDSATRGAAHVMVGRSGGVYYDVINVSGRGIKKVQAPGFLPDGRVPRANRKLIKQLAIDNLVGAMVNADASYTVDDTYAKMHGINITDGIAYQSFGESPLLGPGTEDFDTEAAALYADGVLRRISVDDGMTAVQYVASGVVDTFGHGPVIVNDGIDTQWYTKPGYQEFVTKLSARTILGQRTDGSFVIILVHGKTGSYGMAGKDMSDLALSVGCEIAVNLDGGGSTQGIWNGYTFHASTDAIFERGIMSAIAITSPQTNEYDSGSISFATTALVKQSSVVMPAMSVRAVGGMVRAEFNLVADAPVAFEKNKWILVSDETVPEFLLPRSFQESRATIAAGSGDQMTASLASDRKFYIRDNGTSSKNLATGMMQWPMRDYLGDR